MAQEKIKGKRKKEYDVLCNGAVEQDLDRGTLVTTPASCIYSSKAWLSSFWYFFFFFVQSK